MVPIGVATNMESEKDIGMTIKLGITSSSMMIVATTYSHNRAP